MATSGPNSGPTLEALLGFVAVSDVHRADEVLSQLCLQCLVTFPDEPFSSSGDFSNVLKTFFGLDIGHSRIQSALDRLINQGQINRFPDTKRYGPNATFRARVEARIRAARELQECVRTRWLNQCEIDIKQGFDGILAWECLQQYLSALFRRHGLQTVLLLDARPGANIDRSAALKSSLEETLSGLDCNGNKRGLIERAVHLFLETVGSDADRTKFVVQLADGAFTYYSLSAPPEVAARLQSQLKELTLFLDTNFLFGLLGLHVNPFDAVSEELISLIQKNNLPFKLRYHESTLDEMHRTIVGITSYLKGRYWPQALSRAAARALFLSSIERKFHETNAIQTVDPDTFFKPYEHPDELLKSKGILIYHQAAVRLEQRADLISRYQEFLAAREREKPYEAIDHDMTVLDCVRQQRSTAPSSLDAKALIITCDTILARFDWKELRSKTELACTVLPNQLLQLLRPFVTSSLEFDKSFAESFAMPEFRTISSSSEASRKLLSLLSSYKEITEETAVSLLANELLIERLKKSKDDRQFKELVDAALVAENADLLEEIVALKEEHAVRVESLEAQRADAEVERNKLREENLTLGEQISGLATNLSEMRSQSAQNLTKLENELRSTQQQSQIAQQQAQRTASILAMVTATICAILFAVISEWLIVRYDWTWLLSHPNSYALRAVSYSAETMFFFGLFRPTWRKYCWWGSVGAVALLVIILGLLGGPKP